MAQLVGSRNAVAQSGIDRFNAAVPLIVAARSRYARLVDQRGVTAAYLPDTLHPSDAGYHRMAATWFAAWRPVAGR